MENLSDTRSPERKPALNLKVGLTALSLLGTPYGHDRAEAMEIPPTATWQEGMRETEKSVLADAVEHKITFVQYADGTSIWAPTIKGVLQQVTSSPEKVITGILNSGEKNTIQTLCDMHTHPSHSAVNEFSMPTGLVAGTFYVPPSFGDTQVGFLRSKRTVEAAKALGVEVQSVVQAAGDPKGIWYYRDLTEEEKKEINFKEIATQAEVDRFDQAQKDFVIGSASSPVFNFSIEYQKLQIEYQRIGTKVRFVSYADVQKEGQCTGVDSK